MKHLLDKLAVLHKREETGTDRLNRPSYSWVAQPDPVRVHRQKGSGREVPTGGGNVEVAEWLFFASPEQAIDRFDRLVYEGQTYNLISVEPIEPPFQPVSHYEIMARVM